MIPTQQSYDDEFDILYMKAKEECYDHSVRVDSFIIDFNEKDCIIGLRILDATEILGLHKEALKNISSWRLIAQTHENTIHLRLSISANEDGSLVERNPVLFQSLHEKHFKDTQTMFESG
jgi:uncharacterized protein YuzE